SRSAGSRQYLPPGWLGKNAAASERSPTGRWRNAADCRAPRLPPRPARLRSSALPPLPRAVAVQLGQVLQLVANLQLQAARHGLVVATRLQRLGEIVLAGGIGVRLVVGIAVFLAVTQLLHQPCRRV